MSLNHFQFVTIIVVDKLNDDRQDPDRFPSLDIGFLVLLHGSQARQAANRAADGRVLAGLDSVSASLQHLAASVSP